MRRLCLAALLLLPGCASGPRWEPCRNETCAQCLGSGSFECKPCGTTGHVDCTVCRKGEVSCRWCFGIGYETGGYKCISCLGKGRIECRRCRGTLRAACRKCEGTGRAKCGRVLTNQRR